MKSMGICKPNSGEIVQGCDATAADGRGGADNKKEIKKRANHRNRTDDLQFTKLLLYRLS